MLAGIVDFTVHSAFHNFCEFYTGIADLLITKTKIVATGKIANDYTNPQAAIVIV